MLVSKTVTLDVEDVLEADKLIRKHKLKGMSHFVQLAVKEYLKSIKSKEETENKL